MNKCFKYENIRSEHKQVVIAPREETMRKQSVLKVLLAGTAVALAAESAAAQGWGSFDGTTIQAKLIGGQQYEGLYGRIADWEAATGGKVDIISKKSHFEIDKEIKSDMAAGTTDWCVGSNHSSFAPQYEGLYVDLNGLVPEDVIAGFVPGNIAASTVDGELLMLPRAQFDVSVLYYLNSNYEDEAQSAAFEAEYGYPLAVPDTWDQVRDQAITEVKPLSANTPKAPQYPPRIPQRKSYKLTVWPFSN